MWVFDATQLIYLAKVERLTLVDHVETSCGIPERVYEEVVATGLEEGYPDARRIERSVEADRFEVVSTKTTPLSLRLQENRQLSAADVAVLAYAGSTDSVAVMDETYGRDVAAAEGITTRGTAFLVLKCATRGAISGGDARTIIDAMIDNGWYCAPDVYTKIVKKIETISD